jgi:hypothetical protein
MKTQKNRVKKLEQKAPPFERQFIGWIGRPWTPRQMAKAICREPDRRVFWKSLLDRDGN